VRGVPIARFPAPAYGLELLVGLGVLVRPGGSGVRVWPGGTRCVAVGSGGGWVGSGGGWVGSGDGCVGSGGGLVGSGGGTVDAGGGWVDAGGGEADGSAGPSDGDPVVGSGVEDVVAVPEGSMVGVRVASAVWVGVGVAV